MGNDPASELIELILLNGVGKKSSGELMLLNGVGKKSSGSRSEAVLDDKGGRLKSAALIAFTLSLKSGREVIKSLPSWLCPPCSCTTRRLSSVAVMDIDQSAFKTSYNI